MKKLILLFFVCLSSGVFAQKGSKEVIAYISDAMLEQEASWNKGDLNGFMKHYWNSDSLRFIGKSGVNMGWKATLENYQQSYPNGSAMGKLKFSNLSVEFIDRETVFVIGSWLLERGGEYENLSGFYSLIWKKKNGKWVIVVDHSS